MYNTCKAVSYILLQLFHSHGIDSSRVYFWTVFMSPSLCRVLLGHLYSATSSPNIICQGVSFLMFSFGESIMMENRKWLKADPRWSPAYTTKGRLFLQHTSLQCHGDGPSSVRRTSLAPLVSHMHQYSSYLGTLLSYAFSR